MPFRAPVAPVAPVNHVSGIAYRKLNHRQIRVVTLLPGHPATPIRCDINVISLDDTNLDYIALSWTWGPSATVNQSIIVDDVSHPVRQNLYDAFLALRHESHPLTLWVDAISINQANVEEKNEQIPLMKDIYILANYVAVWLGNNEDESDFVFDCIRHQTYFHTARAVLGCRKLLTRPWFSRTWVLQEFALNKRQPQIFCGHCPSVPFWIFQRSCREIIRIGLEGRIPPSERPELDNGTFSNYAVVLQSLETLTVFSYLRDWSSRSPGDFDLKGALTLSRTFSASDPRDKVYGILGLVDRRIQDQFNAQYPISYQKTVAEVYLDASLYQLHNEQGVYLYVDFMVLHKKDPSVPSWVIDFNSTRISPYRLIEIPSVSPTMDPIQVSSDQQRLTLKGVILDTVKGVVPAGPLLAGLNPNQSNNVPQLALSRLRCAKISIFRSILNTVTGMRLPDIADELKNTSGLTPEYQLTLLKLIRDIDALMMKRQKRIPQLAEPLWKTLLGGDNTAQDYSNKGFASLQLDWHELVMFVRQHRSSLSISIGMNKLRRENGLPAAFLHSLSGRSFFTSSNEWYGITDIGVQKGDLLALLFPQINMPFILRQKSEGYQMLGVAYIPQSMRDTAIAQQAQYVRDFTIV